MSTRNLKFIKIFKPLSFFKCLWFRDFLNSIAHCSVFIEGLAIPFISLGELRNDWKQKNYETYNRSVRVLFSKKCLPQVTFNTSQTNSIVLISVNLKLIWSISCYISLPLYFGLSASIIKYLFSSIEYQISSIK